ncbi:MAG TPA: hypothetical protein VJ995_03175 [Geothermobacteraceae bacterium]|nr:hypothetical protein [Geothermobacteraceae bacterium]
MWFRKEPGNKIFTGGQEAWEVAAAVAGVCASFKADDEDEQCAEETLSCYNCRYRRWTADSFACLAL